uniref:Tudor-knot domain-containing protein n=1 Tax=Aegilops tauschii subsp. strangulata TaxID=200361 RepID=A0A453B134_AEGTS
ELPSLPILSDDEMGSMELSTAPENGTAAAAAACNGGAAPANGGVERRLRSSAASASWAAHLPLEVGTRVMCRWRDQKPHPVKVIERRKSAASSSPADYEYYVHYTECEQPTHPAPSGRFGSRVRSMALQVGESWI